MYLTREKAARLEWYCDHEDELTAEQRENMRSLLDEWQERAWDGERLDEAYRCGAID